MSDRMSEREREARWGVHEALKNPYDTVDLWEAIEKFADAREAAVREELGEVLAEGEWTNSCFGGFQEEDMVSSLRRPGVKVVKRARLVAVKEGT